jgi:hypothetical protein
MLKILSFPMLLVIVGTIANSAPPSKKGVAPKMSGHHFGSCCKDLSDAIKVENSFFRVESNGVLYFTVGYVKTAQGPGFFDQAVLFCPFCGKQLQTKADIASRSKA